MTAHAESGSTRQQPAHQESTHQPNPAPTRGLNPLQREYLLKPLDARRVRQVQGMNHLEAWDIRRHLTRYLGFGGWSYTTDAELVREIETPASNNGRSRWTVIYRAKVRLVIRDPHGNELAYFEEYAAGDAVNQPSLGDAHDLALKTAESQALKRAATNMGDGFGLSLYDGGGHLTEDGKHVRPVIQATLDVYGNAPSVQDEPVSGEQVAA